jgi:hypothetical protein
VVRHTKRRQVKPSRASAGSARALGRPGACAGQHPAQVRDHLRVDVLAAWAVTGDQQRLGECQVLDLGRVHDLAGHEPLMPG